MGALKRQQHPEAKGFTILAGMSRVVSVTSFPITVNSSSLSPGLRVWERLELRRDASSLSPLAARLSTLALDSFEQLIPALSL